MSNAKQEILSIKRDSDSIDGKVLNFLKTSPISPGSTLSDVVMVTLKAHWLPLVLYSQGVRGEQLRVPTLWALHQLEAQINLIRRICGIDPNY
ncbi:hypothetical protein [Nodularia sp. UHCC 0506]|uniref:hypothetical protein n=1 Tax=Nodularia sp. UHCC 0506 TaxID=3110243 RepID=UPI002B1FF915|nr:hypothetical protein [Nodularia sp. UHCC 0506]MEA5517289.1 hypothetical protein [Nodularia sp. UHCC 0506]